MVTVDSKMPSASRFGAHVQRHFDRWRFLLQEDGRGIRLFQRHVFQVDALDLEYWLQIFVRHGALSYEFWDNEERQGAAHGSVIKRDGNCIKTNMLAIALRQRAIYQNRPSAF
jgi:hypothetical protein